MAIVFDVHSHIQYPAYDADRDTVIARAQNIGVKMIVSGTQLTSSLAAIRLAEQYPNDVWATVGFHPNHAVLVDRAGGVVWYHDKNEQHENKPEIFDSAQYREFGKNKTVVAIGECGLDYYRIIANRELQIAKQKEIFIAQLELAKEFKKPLVIHARPSKGTDDAYEDVLAILQSSDFRHPTVFHFYAGSLSMTKKLVEAGSFFTFGGVTTFGDDYSERVRMIPLERIMLETDAPYVAPVPYRGKRNEPAYVVETAKRIAAVKGISYDEIARQTTANALIVFGITI